MRLAALRVEYEITVTATYTEIYWNMKSYMVLNCSKPIEF
jgi:hypothetical protein